ncbi:hypothetical protein BUALT_Bualt05G0070500 [Buddleja alternifolia]|uniref:Uncharacterized protein n=1 Tax=Buddleja alternifolia TaxID=168488 RepID=A0AAV6XHA5_9LAMI|nr:hypothetical protein BUALT_Bualt05G0070500 [Buddleja alternifolia]
MAKIRRTDEAKSMRNGVMEALQPPPYLSSLSTDSYQGKCQFLGREFLGIATSEDINPSLSSPSSTSAIGFLKLKLLVIFRCPKLKEWEDITVQEGESAIMSIMPCLKQLDIGECDLTVLPHRLIRKATSLETLSFHDCNRLVEHYDNQECSDWMFLSHIPNIEVSN